MNRDIFPPVYFTREQLWTFLSCPHPYPNNVHSDFQIFILAYPVVCFCSQVNSQKLQEVQITQYCVQSVYGLFSERAALKVDVATLRSMWCALSWCRRIWILRRPVILVWSFLHLGDDLFLTSGSDSDGSLLWCHGVHDIGSWSHLICFVLLAHKTMMKDSMYNFHLSVNVPLLL